MYFKVKYTYNIDLLYKRFHEIFNNENFNNEGEFSEKDLFVVIKLIDFFRVHATPKEKKLILDLLNGEW